MTMRMTSCRVMLPALTVFVLLSTACNRRDNLTGDNWSGITPRIAVTDSFDLGFSYQHEGKVRGNESHLVCGNDEGITSIAIMRFTGIPDTITVTEQPKLRLVATRRSALTVNPLQLSFHKLSQNWAADSTDDVQDINISPLDIPSFTVADSIHADGDSLVIAIPNAIIENWKIADITGFNLVIKTVNGGWLEFKSAERGLSGPTLSFKYQVPNDTTTYSYSQRPVRDSYKISGTQTQVINNLWKVKNLLPQRMFVKFTLPDSLFKDMNNNVLSDRDRQRMTINRAELVLFTKSSYYYDDNVCYLYPYNVKKDTLSIPMVITDSDIEDLAFTFSSVKPKSADSVKVNITPIIQAYTSGDKQNKGIVIKCTSEMQNFGSLEFWHFSNAPDEKKPYLIIYYTTPFLKGD